MNNRNYLILDFADENVHLLLINNYGPRSDTSNCYAIFMDKILDGLNIQHIIVGGDFNHVMNNNLDI